VQGVRNISSLVLPDKKVAGLNTAATFSESDENIIYLPYSEITSVPGEYSLQDSAGMSFSFPLNYNSNESNTLKMSEEETTKYFEKSGVKDLKYIQNPDELTKVVTETRTGFGLWKYMLIGALIFLLAELFLSKYLEKS
ncbi:MAG: hypothetical protein WAU38_01480, partial [Ignavibacteria bacterium]